jgi:hypothetical protein
LKVIQRIREKVIKQEYEFTIPHFFEEMANDNLVLEDIIFAIENGFVRRKFTNDPRGTRYEVVGNAKDSKEIAVICRFKNTGKLLFITVYKT